MKFFTKRGGLSSPEVEEICNRAAMKYANRVVKVSTLLRTPPSKVDFMAAYSQHLRDIIKQRINHPLHYDTPLKGFQVLAFPFTLSMSRYEIPVILCQVFYTVYKQNKKPLSPLI